MSRSNAGAILREVHTLFTAGTFSGLTDRELLERFVARRDASSERAFTVLIERHGPMVLGVCRRILSDPYDAEDAFQATFLVLVRKAGSIRVDGSVGRWLFGVATKVAARARADARRRRTREKSGLDRVEIRVHDPTATTADRIDLQSILAEELGKLPAKLQAAVMLCDLEGSSQEDAARRLGWPVGTVKSRLSRARARLRVRLTRRGLAPTELSTSVLGLPAALPQNLVEATARAAQSLIAGRLTTAGIVSASVTLLTEGVLRAMFLTKLKLVAVGLLVIASGSAVLVSRATAQKPAATTESLDNRATPAKTANDAATRDAETDLIMLERAWADAIPRRDVAIIGRILADDFAGIDAIRNPYTKATYIRDVENGSPRAEPIEFDEVKPRIFGETGVVTSRIKINNGTISSWMTNVYVKRQGRWQCVASHGCWNTGFIAQSSATGAQGPANLGRTSSRADQITRIRPRFDCLVEKVYVRPGAFVKKGDPLADLFSADLAAAKNDYRLKNVQWQHDRRLLKMRQKLAESNAISQQTLVDSQGAESRSLLEFQIAQRKLTILGLDDEAIGRVETEVGTQSARLTLHAPVSGTVIEVGAEPGNLYNTKDSLMAIAAPTHPELGLRSR